MRANSNRRSTPLSTWTSSPRGWPSCRPAYLDDGVQSSLPGHDSVTSTCHTVKGMSGDTDPAVEGEGLSDQGPPTCPQCGWRSTRLSHTRSLLDFVLQAFAVYAYLCRSCGNRF